MAIGLARISTFVTALPELAPFVVIVITGPSSGTTRRFVAGT
jgi:hypothetical protein